MARTKVTAKKQPKQGPPPANPEESDPESEDPDYESEDEDHCSDCLTSEAQCFQCKKGLCLYHWTTYQPFQGPRMVLLCNYCKLFFGPEQMRTLLEGLLEKLNKQD